MRASVLKRLLEIRDEHLRGVLVDVVEEIERELATREMLEAFIQRTDENLKRVWETIHELAEAQKRTEQRLNELAEAQKETERRLNELAEAQKATERRLNELAEAQKRTEERVDRLERTIQELAEAQKRTEEEIRKLTREVRRNRERIGGVSRSVAYALENEAYRNLPRFLKERYGIEVVERFVRKEIGGREVNVLARGRRDGEEVMIVGEGVLRLDDGAKIRQVLRAREFVERHYGLKAVGVIVCHFARPKYREKAEKEGLLVVESYEWIEPT